MPPKDKIDFTRDDSDRLKAIEIHQIDSCTKLEGIEITLSSFVSLHGKTHIDQDKRIDTNTRFRTVVIRIVVWVFTGGGGLVVAAKAIGWLG